MKRAALVAVAFVAVLSVSLGAQWPKMPNPNDPKDAQGRVQMNAQPPRLANGKPDFQLSAVAP